MRRLTLVRHAKSSWDYPELGDFERPLNARGRRDAPEMARRTLELARPGVRLVSSPALRAITTARLVAECWGLRLEDIAVEPRLYDASCSQLFSVVHGLRDEYANVVLFAHNPGLSELSHVLAKCPFSELPTMAVASFSFDTAHWGEIAPASGRLALYRYPKE